MSCAPFVDDPAVGAYLATCEGLKVTVAPAALAQASSSVRDLRKAGAPDADVVAAAIRCAERGGNPGRIDIDLAAIQRGRSQPLSMVAQAERDAARLRELAS